MSEFVEENVREIFFDLENLPNSLVFALPENNFTYTPNMFAINEHLNIEYYEKRFERAFPGLLDQFPCLYYMVEEWRDKAIQKTPLEEILAKKEEYLLSSH